MKHEWPNTRRSLESKGFCECGCGRKTKLIPRSHAAMGLVRGLTRSGKRSRYSLDRFPNNNGNYESGNVRWATPEQQRQNRRDS